MSFDKWLTTLEAAEALGITRQRVWQLWQEGTLIGLMRGRDLFLDVSSVEDYQRTRRGPGRPRKDDSDRGSRVGDEQYFTTAEVAAKLRVSVETVRNWIGSRALRAVRLGGSRVGYRITSSDLRAFLQQAQERGREGYGSDDDAGG
jgi:excisionase family DNA binding protein